jgi:hypothetical protein
MIMIRELFFLRLFAVVAVASMALYSLNFRLTVSQHGFGVEPFQPNVGNPSQTVDMDPRPLRESLSQAAVGNDTIKAFQPGSRSPLPVRGNSSHPHLSGLRNSSHPHLSGLRVAFVGDSLTRYMYLSLAAYLRFGRWVGVDDKPNILEEKQFGDWNYFYNYTNNLFRPYEQCDCHRPRGKTSRSVENRYFHDPVGNNSIYFFQK